ncbi:UNVERIFIED_ORG: HPt (histidine-containing phosphotransfer) domain-containing protein [Arthrobacter globiformis]|nr:HPt (histidine-containing phosphotransfer) domain-containing protein [Arthrobacter globiformis]
MTQDPCQDLPVLDSSALQDLKDDAGEDVAQAFIEDYLLTLVARAARIFKTFARGDLEESLDAVVSLRTSSEMAGAGRIASYCRGLETALKDGQKPDLVAVQATLSVHIRDVIREASRCGHLPPKSHGSDS